LLCLGSRLGADSLSRPPGLARRRRQIPARKPGQGAAHMRNKQRRPLQVEELEQRLALSSFYVATTGNDNNAGTSDPPFRTLHPDADTVHAVDSVTFRAGNYAGFTLKDSTRSGTANASIRFLAQPGVNISFFNTDGPPTEIYTASYVDIEGFT